jgi:aspartate racemase
MTVRHDTPARPSVGIIGGVGPQATVDLMQRVIDRTPAGDDADHMRMIVDNDPAVPSRIKALIEMTGPSPAPHLASMARGLVAMGADILAMPCNTAHHYLDDIRAAAAPVKVLDMVALTADRIAALPVRPRSVGLLASTAVRLTGLYDQALAERDLQALYPSNQDDVLAVIKAVKAGKAGSTQRAGIFAAANDLRAQGADALVIACTEISALDGALPGAIPALDALDVLADAIVAFAQPSPGASETTTRPPQSMPQGEKA